MASNMVLPRLAISMGVGEVVRHDVVFITAWEKDEKMMLLEDFTRSLRD